MLAYRLLTFVGNGGAKCPGLAVDDRLVDLTQEVGRRAETGQKIAFSAASQMDVLENWDEAEPLLEEIAGDVEAGKLECLSLSDVELLAPLLYPTALFNAAANYHAHVDEMMAKEFKVEQSDKQPYFFLKSPAHCVIGPGAEIPIPHVTQEMDWEAELAVVIGRHGRNLTPEEAPSIIAGYTIYNDLSARDLGRRPDWPNFKNDWFGQKVFEGAAPMGPWIIPAKAIADPSELKIDLWVNDEHMQDAKAGMMIFSPEEQISYLSQRMTLRPGDVIATGTPAGVGKPRGIFLKPGDVVRVTISEIGELSNPVTAGV